MHKSNSKQVNPQLIAAFILTLATVVYTLTQLTDKLQDESSVKVMLLSFALIVLIGIDFYIGYLIVCSIRFPKDEMEDS